VTDVKFSFSSCRRPRVLAVSSGGGHWVQLQRLAPAFEGADVVFATVGSSYRSQVPENRFYVINDATRWNRLALLRMAIRLIYNLDRERPDVVVSTGAAPGYFSLRFGRLLGARTVWIVSIANFEAMSLSGERIRRYADLWLTQWPHLARGDGPFYAGGVI
jgi:UDP-N-acetylglucosamine:LPS N-acetylglucosamine transferase